MMKTNEKIENHEGNKGNKKSASFCHFVDQYVSIINIKNITIIVINVKHGIWYLPIMTTRRVRRRMSVNLLNC